MVFDIDGEKWTLDLRPGSRKVSKGEPEGKPDLTLTISDQNFVKLVMGKMGPQQVRPAKLLPDMPCLCTSHACASFLFCTRNASICA